ncbi:Uncharacterised protein [Mycobacteroides abscessus subsp. abscessus]|nr:Uncharacterised protein [Mycobacteroides abscessus subsp. abscessus]
MPSGRQINTRPSSPAASDTIDAAANERQMLPPTVATFQILKEARSAVAHWKSSGCARQPGLAGSSASCAMVAVAAIRRPPSGSSSKGSQSMRLMSTTPLEVTCGSEKNHVPPATMRSPSARVRSSRL